MHLISCIFNNNKQLPTLTAITNAYQLMSFVFAFCLDHYTLSWDALSFCYNDKNHPRRNKLYQPSPQNEDILVVPEMEFCQSKRMTVFLGSIYVYKGLLMVSYTEQIHWKTYYKCGHKFSFSFPLAAPFFSLLSAANCKGPNLSIFLTSRHLKWEWEWQKDLQEEKWHRRGKLLCLSVLSFAHMDCNH